ncbi:MAG: DUF5666 domain-containing protein [Acidobacteriota bacterium]
MKQFIFLAAILISFSSLSAAPAEIEFSGELVSIDTLSEQVADLGIELTDQFIIFVRVTGRTEIHDDGTAMTLAQLGIGDILSVEGLVTGQSILAQEIEIAEEDNDFEIRGRIDSIVGDQIIVIGLAIQVPETAEIRDSQGAMLSFGDLALKQFVKVEGEISEDGEMAASEVEILHPGRRVGRLKFEGTILSLSGTELLVQVEGVGPVLVQITDDTEIEGDLAEGAIVKVQGRLNPDLSVLALEITVQRPLRLAPHKLKMRLNQTRHVQVILDRIFDVDVQIDLLSLDPAVVQTSTPILTIPAGTIASEFNVLSGAVEGETSVEVTLTSPDGVQSVILEVEVEQRGEGNNGNGNNGQGGGHGPGGEDDEEEIEIEIKWVPDDIKSLGNETRTVKLELDEPAPAGLTATLFLRAGKVGLVQFPAEVVFPEGSTETDIQIVIADDHGKVKIRASLPDFFGGEDDELEVEVERDDD